MFRYAGCKYSHTNSTDDEAIAQGLVGGIERTLLLLNQKVLKVPDGVDVFSFVVGNGQVDLARRSLPKRRARRLPADITLRDLKDRYLEAHSAGAMETNSLDTVALQGKRRPAVLGGHGRSK